MGTRSMTPVEYEVLFAIFQLKKRGVHPSTLNKIHAEVNTRRRQKNMPTLSAQHVHYYLKRISARPFVKKENSAKVAQYSLVIGDFKLDQFPPLCVHIDKVAEYVLICDKTSTCKHPFCIDCLTPLIKELVATGKIPLELLA